MKVKIFLIVFSLIVLIRLFIFDITLVTSGSMENTIMTGDFLITNEIYQHLPLCRFNYYDKIVFKSVENNDENIIKSCVGLPSDTIQICDDFLFINGKIDTISNKKMIFKFQLKKMFIEESVLKKIEYWSINNNIKAKSLYKGATLNQNQLVSLKRFQLLKYLEPIFDTICCNRKRIIQGEIDKKWDYSNIGPLVIPYKGLSVKITSGNYELYERIISEEGHEINYHDNKFFIDSSDSPNYTFKKNYYFVLGDNRFNSYDSRFFGFVSESNIKGKVIINISDYYRSVLFSYNK